MAKKPKLGSGKRFAGIKAHGKKQMAKWAVAGRKRTARKRKGKP